MKCILCGSEAACMMSDYALCRLCYAAGKRDNSEIENWVGWVNYKLGLWSLEEAIENNDEPEPEEQEPEEQEPELKEEES